MIIIREAIQQDAEILVSLGKTTYSESHGSFIQNKNDLSEYLETAFSIEKIISDLTDTNTIFYIIYKDDIPFGYAQTRLNSSFRKSSMDTSCELERIYILSDYIHLKVGQQLLSYIENKVAGGDFNVLWLSVYKENKRAIRFYEKNGFKEIGKKTFKVNGAGYENLVFSKKI